MGNKFLFIEISDMEISSLLNSLREIFSNKKFHIGMHITIKGPQKTFRTKSIKNFLEENKPIQIHDAGMFMNGDTYIVYMKAKCENLKRYIWRKPNYEGEYNPHITLYKGLEKHIADAVLDFLKEENISLVCNKYNIATYTLHQPDLFTTASSFEDSDLKTLIEGGSIKGKILSRARKMVIKAQISSNKSITPTSDHRF